MDLIAQVLFSDTRSDTPAPEENGEESDGPELLIPEGEIGGPDGTLFKLSVFSLARL